MAPTDMATSVRDAAGQIGDQFVVATIHPSAILRAEERREAEMAAFTEDLAAAWALIHAA